LNSYLAALFTFIIILVFLRFMYFLTQRGAMDSAVSGGFIYLGTGTLYLLCWLMYPDVQNGRWLAALVPLVAIIYFALIGMGVVKDNAAVKAMTRTGNPREMLFGPILYSLVLISIALLYWKDSVFGLPALAVMCGGIGIAELLGVRKPVSGVPWSIGRNLVRALSIFAGGWLVSILILEVFIWIGFFSGPIDRFFLPVTWIALGGALVGLLPVQELDTILVPMVCVLIGYLVFK
jgi:hypothetical protein